MLLLLVVIECCQHYIQLSEKVSSLQLLYSKKKLKLFLLSNVAHKIGAPVVRPLFFADPCDPALRDADSGFLLGEGENYTQKQNEFFQKN